MNDFLRQSWSDLLFYWFANPGSLWRVESWMVLVLATLSIFLLTKLLLFTKRETQRQERDQKRMVFHVLETALLAYSIVMTVVIGLMSYYWSNGYYEQTNQEGVHLLTVLLLLIFPLGICWQMRSLFKGENRRDLFGQPLSSKQEQRRLNFSMELFRKRKLWVLLPALGFLLLAVMQKSSRNLVSIVLDTSYSMSLPGTSGEIPLENGKYALASNINSLGDNTDFIITTFSDGEELDNMYKVLSISNYESLLGHNMFFTGQEKAGLLNYLSSLDVVAGSSPICETIWKNFLFTREQELIYEYDEIVSIVVTDGKGVLPANQIDQFFCAASDYDEFFSPERVNIINLSEDFTNELIQQATDCGYLIEDGFDSQNYLASLDKILADFKKSWSYPFWLGLIFLLCSVTCFSITPNLF